MSLLTIGRMQGQVDALQARIDAACQARIKILNLWPGAKIGNARMDPDGPWSDAVYLGSYSPLPVYGDEEAQLWLDTWKWLLTHGLTKENS